MKKTILLIALTILPLCLRAQEQEAAAVQQQLGSARDLVRKSGAGVFSGISGGMMLHIGYMFSDDPRKIFSNAGLGNAEYVKNLPKDGCALGLGGTMRVHLLDHIHVGAEGGMSIIPFRSHGNIRIGYGGALCDGYLTLGKTRPMIGLSLGGGVMKRLYLPEEPYTYVPEGTTDTTVYNASYTQTPFFYLDPYIGIEIDIATNIALLIRVDYMLPFGRTKSGWNDVVGDVKWDNFMTPTGPRLYIGFMFGKF